MSRCDIVALSEMTIVPVRREHESDSLWIRVDFSPITNRTRHFWRVSAVATGRRTRGKQRLDHRRCLPPPNSRPRCLIMRHTVKKHCERVQLRHIRRCIWIDVIHGRRLSASRHTNSFEVKTVAAFMCAHPLVCTDMLSHLLFDRLWVIVD